MKSKLPQEHIDFIVNTIRKVLKRDQFKIILFGSFANGNPSRLSDIDIALLSKKPLDLAKLSMIKEYFEESDFLYSVDVIDLARVSKNFGEKVLQAGMVLYSNLC